MDFIIGGAPRCATTWLHQALDRHPDVYMAKPVIPEPKFFVADKLYARGIEYYRENWFSGVDEKKVAGVKTSYYLESSVAAGRISKNLPDVKLIFLLRDPVQRAFSNYLWSKMNNKETEDFETALKLEKKRERNWAKQPEEIRYQRPHAYFSRGLYADLLQIYFDLFPRRQILCMRVDQLEDFPEDLLTRVHKFLGIGTRPLDASDIGKINKAACEGEEAIPERIFKQLREAYLEPNRRLAKLLGPEFDSFGHTTDKELKR